MDSPYPDNKIKNIAKLERIYLLKEFYNLKLGLDLFNFNADLSKQNKQMGMWLFVWKENKRAVNFYKKMGLLLLDAMILKSLKLIQTQTIRCF